MSTAPQSGLAASNLDATSIAVTNRLKLRTLIKALRADLDNLLANQDINVMAGDIMKAYDGNLHTLPYLVDNETVEFVYDENFLMQFKHATVLDIPTASYGAYYNPIMDVTDKAPYNPSYLSMRHSILFRDAGNKLVPYPNISQENNALIADVYYVVDNGSTDQGGTNTDFAGHTMPTISIGAFNGLIIDTNTTPTPALNVE